MNKLTFVISILILAGCSSTVERLKWVGKPPPFEKLQDPASNPNYKLPENPLPGKEEEETRPKLANSLWQPGARTFFRDQRARRVGDILKVAVKINDTASLDNKTEQKRTNANTGGITNLYGLENKIPKYLPTSFSPAALINTNGDENTSGSGNIARKETIQTEIAAMVTQILPNGNLVIQGRQEIRVNYELREILVAGIVRPEDISAENGISSDQIAEAKISYGGRGTVSDLQKPRIGEELRQILSPF